jgi:hypothetical protein
VFRRLAGAHYAVVSVAFLGVLFAVGELWARGAVVAEDPWGSSPGGGAVFVMLAAGFLLGMSELLRVVVGAWVLRTEGRVKRTLLTRRAATLTALVAAAAAAGLWLTRPLWHGVAILFYEYPLVTWIPLLAGLLPVAMTAVATRRRPRVERSHPVGVALSWQTPAVLLAWAIAMLVLPALQGCALYEASVYVRAASLPLRTQPRLLPKEAAQQVGRRAGLEDEHLVVDQRTDELVFSGRIGSGGIAVQPLDRAEGTIERRPGRLGAVTGLGPGSLAWRAYRRHFLTRVMEEVVVPLRTGEAVVVAPYIGFKGFPVRRPFWEGVYVLHGDGRLEDLTPSEALARRDLVAAGRLFPEKLARDIAEAYGYRDGPLARLHGDRTVVSDPEGNAAGRAGNPQPYLTNLGDGVVRWVTVAHSPGERDDIDAVFLTDSTTGRTEIWRPPPRVRLLSNAGAVRLVRRLDDFDWTDCCDDRGHSFDVLRATEPRAVFARGRLFYLVSVLPESGGLDVDGLVDGTVVVDAVAARVVHVYASSDAGADASLRAFFGSSS